MTRALPLIALCAACDGAIVTPAHVTSIAGTSAETPTGTEVLFETTVRDVPLDAHALFQTVEWNLAHELTADALPVRAAIDVRPIFTGGQLTGLELLNPRFAVLPDVALDVYVSKLSIGVAPGRVDAFADVHAVTTAAHEQVVGPGLVVSVTSPVFTSPAKLSLKFAATLAKRELAPVEPLATLESGRRYLVTSSCAAQHVVAIAGAALTDEALVVLAPAQAGHDEQVFEISDHPAGGVTLLAVHSGRELNVPRGSSMSGTQLIQWRAEDAAHPNQRFTASREADGTYRFAAVHSGLFIAASADAVVQSTDAAGCEQRFVLMPVP